MKFLIRFSLLITLCFSNSLAFSADKFTVVTTFTVIADMAQNVAGDAADILSITKPGAEIHNYQPTPRDIIKAQNADLVLWNGLNLELWFEKFFKNLSDVPNVIVTENIKPMGIVKGPYRGKPNPHAWMSPTDAMIYVDNIERALSTHDPKNAGAYAKNAQIYKRKYERLFCQSKNVCMLYQRKSAGLLRVKVHLVIWLEILTFKNYLSGRLMPMLKEHRSRYVMS